MTHKFFIFYLFSLEKQRLKLKKIEMFKHFIEEDILGQKY